MKNIAVVTGGFSGEDVISHKSAEMVMNNIDRKQFNPYLVVINRKGWYCMSQSEEWLIDKSDFSVLIDQEKIQFEAVFMALHGDPGENGVLQGYFELLGIPMTTGDFFNMAITFNKFATIQWLKAAGFPVAESVLLQKGQSVSEAHLIEKVGLPCFVKPNYGGSSLGISRVDHSHELSKALELAFSESDQVMIESFMEGREFTCGVIQKKNQTYALAVTEIVSKNEFFDFESKYNPELVDEITPAPIPTEDYQKCQSLAEETFISLQCKGMARIDFIHTSTGFKIIEINTVPGLTEVSIYPQMAIYSGISKKELISILLNNLFE